MSEHLGQSHEIPVVFERIAKRHEEIAALYRALKLGYADRVNLINNQLGAIGGKKDLDYLEATEQALAQVAQNTVHLQAVDEELDRLRREIENLKVFVLPNADQQAASDGDG